jgi:hypothetical protein
MTIYPTMFCYVPPPVQLLVMFASHRSPIQSFDLTVGPTN